MILHSRLVATKSKSPSTAVGVGEDLRLQYEAAAEDSKQKAIRCTEEVVRREEEERRQQTLVAARKEWQLERQELFREAHESQLRAIARQNGILEKKLRQEFTDTVAQMQVCVASCTGLLCPDFVISQGVEESCRGFPVWR